jgi:hypothetical protein
MENWGKPPGGTPSGTTNDCGLVMTVGALGIVLENFPVMVAGGAGAEEVEAGAGAAAIVCVAGCGAYVGTAG